MVYLDFPSIWCSTCPLNPNSKPTRPKGTWLSHCPNSGKSEMSIFTRKECWYAIGNWGVPMGAPKKLVKPQPSLSVGMRCLFIIVIHGPKLFVSSGKEPLKKKIRQMVFFQTFHQKYPKMDFSTLWRNVPYYLHVPVFSHPVMASNFITAGLFSCSKEGGQQQQL